MVILHLLVLLVTLLPDKLLASTDIYYDIVAYNDDDDVVFKCEVNGLTYIRTDQCNKGCFTCIMPNHTARILSNLFHPYIVNPDTKFNCSEMNGEMSEVPDKLSQATLLYKQDDYIFTFNYTWSTQVNKLIINITKPEQVHFTCTDEVVQIKSSHAYSNHDKHSTMNSMRLYTSSYSDVIMTTAVAEQTAFSEITASPTLVIPSKHTVASGNNALITGIVTGGIGILIVIISSITIILLCVVRCLRNGKETVDYGSKVKMEHFLPSKYEENPIYESTGLGNSYEIIKEAKNLKSLKRISSHGPPVIYDELVHVYPSANNQATSQAVYDKIVIEASPVKKGDDNKYIEMSSLSTRYILK